LRWCRAPAGAGGATAPKAAGVFWWATQRSKSAGDTVKARNFMLAWLAPQYSLQLPFSALSAIESFGVNHR
jgi:hypothetical protein